MESGKKKYFHTFLVDHYDRFVGNTNFFIRFRQTDGTKVFLSHR